MNTAISNLFRRLAPFAGLAFVLSGLLMAQSTAGARIEELKQKLNLTPEQVERVTPVLEREVERARRLLAGLDRDSASVRDKRQAARDLRAIQEDTGKQLQRILSPAQFKQFKHLREEQRDKARQAWGAQR